MSPICRLTVLALAILPGGCSSDEKQPPQEEKVFELGPSCTDYAIARCATMERCASALFVYEFGTADLCQQQLSAWCNFVGSLDTVRATPKNIGMCASTFETMSCDTWVGRRERVNNHDDDVEPLCDAPGGILTDGEPCLEGYECESKACYLDTQGVCGTCQPNRDQGDGCRRSMECPTGTTCVGNKCVETAVSGESCDSLRPCAGYLVCLEGTCVMSPAIGEPCADGCDNKLFTECRDGVCHSMAVALPGEECGKAGHPAVCGGSTCSSGNKCQSPVEAQRRCGGPKDGTCQQPLRCVGGWCKPVMTFDCP